MINPDSNRLITPIYTAEDSSVKDLKRLRRFLVPVFLVFFVIMYLIFFLWYIYGLVSQPSGSIAIWKIFHAGVLGIIVSVVGAILILLAPIVLGIWGLNNINKISEGFTRSFYNLADVTGIRTVIGKRVLGVPPLPSFLSFLNHYPTIKIDGHKLDDQFTWAHILGGPARLNIDAGYAAYLERGGKYSRVVGSWNAFLERYETIREIVDLRPQAREIKVKAWSNDGIELTVHIMLECQILSSEDAESSREVLVRESEKQIYPFHAQAVKAAVEKVLARLSQDDQLEKYGWVAGVCEKVDYYVRRHVFRNTINNLLRGDKDNQPDFMKGAIKEDLQFSSANPKTNNEKPTTLLPFSNDIKYIKKPTLQLFSKELRDMIQKNVNEDIKELGARLINLQIYKVDRPPEVDQQWADNWKAEWERLNLISEGESRAHKIRVQERAHSQAQKDLILTIAESFENMDDQTMREHMLLSLSGMLESSLANPNIRSNLPKETMEILEKIQSFLQDKKL